MNPCTLMGGFWFEAGRFAFGIALFLGCVALLAIFYWWIGRR